jgi:hypothetical protein
MCGAMSARMSVVILDRVAASEFAPAIRGMCGVPAGIMAGAPMAQVQSVIRGITSAGREPVLLATRPAELTGYGATPRHLVDLVTTQDAHDLTQPPSTTWPISGCRPRAAPYRAPSRPMTCASRSLALVQGPC